MIRFAFLLFTLLPFVVPGRDTLAVYEGGHFSNKTLVLFTDSTFYYEEQGDILFIGSNSEGTFRKTDSIIALSTERSFSRLRKRENRLHTTTWRTQGKKILFYTPQQEKENASFHKAYNTLYLVKCNGDCNNGTYRLSCTGMLSFDLTLTKKASEVTLLVKPGEAELEYRSFMLSEADSLSRSTEADKAMAVRYVQFLDSMRRVNPLWCTHDTIIQLSLKEWNHFDSLVNACNYWALPRYRPDPPHLRDGCWWTLEASFPMRHWSVCELVPAPHIEACGLYMMRLASLNTSPFTR